MRIAILGNMNNNANNLIKYLRDEGFDCELLFYSNEASHFVPDADNIEPIDYPSRVLNWGSYSQLLTTPASRIRSDLAPYDFLIGSRLAPSYTLKANRRLDIFMPTGGDLHMLPMFSGFGPKDFFKFLIYSKRQRQGIGLTETLFWDETNQDTEQKIAPVIQNMDRISHAIPAIYHPDYAGENLTKRTARSEWLPSFQKAREDADIFLFHHVKHVWTPRSIRHYGKFHEKGNDQIILGLKRYYDRRPKRRLKIAMFEYGEDHAKTRDLAKKLNVDQHIAWFPQMARKELMMGIGISDAVLGEVTRSWFSYGTIMEAMVMKKAVIHHRDDRFYKNKELYPMVNVYDEESIADAFGRIEDGKINLEQIGIQSHQWFVKYGVGEALKEIITRIDQKRID